MKNFIPQTLSTFDEGNKKLKRYKSIFVRKYSILNLTQARKSLCKNFDLRSLQEVLTSADSKFQKTVKPAGVFDFYRIQVPKICIEFTKVKKSLLHF